MELILAAVGIFAIGALLATAAQAETSGDEVPRMQPGDLEKRLNEDGLRVLDLRQDHDWDPSDRKIVGAERRDPSQVESWAPELDKDETYVLYCG